jgi:DNA-binding PadR family transcriptional regulator
VTVLDEGEGRAHTAPAITDLDYTVMAIVGRDGPMSPYDVRKVFAGSLTPIWSSSTGSVYPSIRRLAQAGLIVGSAPEGARNRTTVVLSAQGRRLLQGWLLGITAEVAAATPDPVRTRLFFIDLLNPADRIAIFDRAEESTRAALAHAERRRAERPRDLVTDLISEGVLSELRARLDWLGRVRRAVTAER